MYRLENIIEEKINFFINETKHNMPSGEELEELKVILMAFNIKKLPFCDFDKTPLSFFQTLTRNYLIHYCMQRQNKYEQEEILGFEV